MIPVASFLGGCAVARSGLWASCIAALTHRRIRFRDLRLYQSRDDLKRRQAADELTQLSQELGLY